MANMVVVWIGLLAALVTSGGQGAAKKDEPPLLPERVIIEARVDRNMLDGAGRRSCSTMDELKRGEASQLWFTFGTVIPDADRGWSASGSSSRCGSGSFATQAATFNRALGAPYRILDLTLSRSAAEPTSAPVLVTVESQTLESFDQQGNPVYARTVEERLLGSGSDAELILPLVLPGRPENEAFRVHEVMLRVGIETLAARPAQAYGGLSVTADVPGARILVDGVPVGRTTDDGPTVIDHLPAGGHEVRVVDFSGRSTATTVTVQAGKRAEVKLDVPQIPAPAAGQALAPIGGNLQGFDEYWRSLDGAIMVHVPAGEFTMGSPEGTGEAHERPQHTVQLSGFLIDKTEVSWRQYRKFATATDNPMPPELALGTPDHHPAHNLSWSEAQAYCEWVGGRLPSEAEWEKAARGTDGRIYPWGEKWDPDRCNSWIGGPNRPVAVGTFEACVSPYGLLDMAGNMWEWTADYYLEDYYATSPQQDPPGPDSSRFRVLRGGDWIAQPLFLRAAHRYRMVATTRYRTAGFRCAQDQGD